MFDIKGLRTFAMSAKNLTKAVEFYTNVLGGQITRRVEPTRRTVKGRPSERSRTSVWAISRSTCSMLR